LYIAAKPAASFRGHVAAATIRQHMGAFGKGAREEAWRRLIFPVAEPRPARRHVARATTRAGAIPRQRTGNRGRVAGAPATSRSGGLGPRGLMERV